MLIPDPTVTTYVDAGTLPRDPTPLLPVLDARPGPLPCTLLVESLTPFDGQQGPSPHERAYRGLLAACLRDLAMPEQFVGRASNRPLVDPRPVGMPPPKRVFLTCENTDGVRVRREILGAGDVFERSLERLAAQPPSPADAAPAQDPGEGLTPRDGGGSTGSPSPVSPVDQNVARPRSPR